MATNGLELIGYWHEEGTDDGLPDPHQFVDPTWDAAERDAVLTWLRSGQTLIYFMGISNCRICGCLNGSLELTDGVFVWPEGLAHYIEAHHVRIPERIVARALEVGTVSPELPLENLSENRDVKWWSELRSFHGA